MYEGKQDHINDSFTKCLMILSFMWVNVSKSLINCFLKTHLFVCFNQPEMYLVILIGKGWDSLQQWENTMVSQTESRVLVSKKQGWSLCRFSVTMYSARCGTRQCLPAAFLPQIFCLIKTSVVTFPGEGDHSTRAQRKLTQQIIFLLRAHPGCFPCLCETHRQDANKRRST